MDKTSDKANSGPEAVKAYVKGDVPTVTPDGYHQMDDLAGKDSKKVPNPTIYERGSDGSVDGKI